MTSNQMSDEELKAEIHRLLTQQTAAMCEKKLLRLIKSERDQALTAYKKELLSKANVYNVKSINGELVEPNTGVQAIPLPAIQEDEVE